MLEKALKQNEPSKYFNQISKEGKICRCGELLLTEEQEFNHKPMCKEK